MKFYMLEGLEVYCRAKTVESAYEIFIEENEGEKILLENIKEVIGDTIVYCEEMYGIGGYNTIELNQLVNFDTKEIYFGNEEEIKYNIELLRDIYR